MTRVDLAIDYTTRIWKWKPLATRWHGRKRIEVWYQQYNRRTPRSWYNAHGRKHMRTWITAVWNLWHTPLRGSYQIRYKPLNNRRTAHLILANRGAVRMRQDLTSRCEGVCVCVCNRWKMMISLSSYLSVWWLPRDTGNINQGETRTNERHDENERKGKRIVRWQQI